MASSKVCIKCHQLKDVETGFHRKKHSPDGRCNDCRLCRNAASARWREENPEYTKRWQSENREYLRLDQRARRENRAQARELNRRAAESDRQKIAQQQRDQGITPQLKCDYFPEVTITTEKSK